MLFSIRIEHSIDSRSSHSPTVGHFGSVNREGSQVAGVSPSLIFWNNRCTLYGEKMNAALKGPNLGHMTSHSNCLTICVSRERETRKTGTWEIRKVETLAVNTLLPTD